MEVEWKIEVTNWKFNVGSANVEQCGSNQVNRGGSSK